MPPTEAPPNPAPAAPPPPSAQQPIKVQTRRFGELDHTELVQLLDSLEGDQAKSRFRESIYISVIVYLVIAWFIVYGPKYVFHTSRIVDFGGTVEREAAPDGDGAEPGSRQGAGEAEDSEGGA